MKVYVDDAGLVGVVGRGGSCVDSLPGAPELEVFVIFLRRPSLSGKLLTS